MILILTLSIHSSQSQQFHHPHQFQQHQQEQPVLHRDINKEKEHMKEHMDIPLDVSSMSEEELMFHYFRMHDVDLNGKLDGCELIKSLIHWASENHGHGHAGGHGGHGHAGAQGQGGEIFSDVELASQIDPILENDDKNKDGYIDYPEFVAAQRTVQV